MSAKNISMGGILTALTIILLYLTLLIPTNTLTLLTLAAFMVPIALMRCNLRTSILVYICSSILSFLLLPFNIFFLYTSFFGCYGIIKSLIEGLDKLALEWVLKLIYFNIVFFICINIIEEFLNPSLFDNLNALAAKFLPGLSYGGFLMLWLAGQVVFVLFDYALTLLIDTYYKYFRNN
ncbi:MAG: hypothetical protein RR525_02045 [Cellulosilyticaceae bacterium]